MQLIISNFCNVSAQINVKKKNPSFQNYPLDNISFLVDVVLISYIIFILQEQVSSETHSL